MTPQQIDDFVALRPNPEALRTWAAGLRSGAYTQGEGHTGMLPESGNCLCVLGVGLATLRREDWQAGNALYEASMRMIGLEPDIEVDGEPLHCVLYELNDANKWTFDQFAELFETVATRVEGLAS